MCSKDRNEEMIFDTAVRIQNQAERDAYLSEACGDNGNLRTDVEELLKHHDSMQSFSSEQLRSKLKDYGQKQFFGSDFSRLLEELR